MEHESVDQYVRRQELWKIITKLWEGYNNLLVAIVKQAAIDYRGRWKRLIRRDPESRQMVDESERFFRRDMKYYVNLDGEKVTAALRERSTRRWGYSR